MRRVLLFFQLTRRSTLHGDFEFNHADEELHSRESLVCNFVLTLALLVVSEYYPKYLSSYKLSIASRVSMKQVICFSRNIL